MSGSSQKFWISLMNSDKVAVFTHQFNNIKVFLSVALIN